MPTTPVVTTTEVVTPVLGGTVAAAEQEESNSRLERRGGAHFHNTAHVIAAALTNPGLRRVLLFAITLRLAAAAFLGNPYDFEIWRSTVSVVYGYHVNTYFWWSQGPLSLLGILASALPLPALATFGLHLPVPVQNLFLHLFFIAGDCVVAYALLRILAGSRLPTDEQWRRRTVAAWAFLPGFWWIGAAHGQTDSWIPASVLLAIALLLDKKPGWAGVALGVGTGILYVPILVAPVLLIYAYRRCGAKGAALWLGGVGMTFAFSMVPLLLTDMTLGWQHGMSLLLERNAWWSAGAQTAGAGHGAGLGSVVSSPYPVLLALGRHNGTALSIISHLPLAFTSVAVVGGPLLYLVMAGTSPRGVSPYDVDRVLLLCAAILLVAGGLNSATVVQRLYWSAPLSLTLAARRKSDVGLIAVSIFSWLYLLPEFFMTSPTLYLRGPFEQYAFNRLVAFVVDSWAGFGLLKQFAPVFGAVVVPFGFTSLLVVAAQQRRNTTPPVLRGGALGLLDRLVAAIPSQAVAILSVIAVGISLGLRWEYRYVQAVLALSVPAVLGAGALSMTFADPAERRLLCRAALSLLAMLSVAVVLVGPIGNVIVRWW